jgi:O-antigen/teichoic acid export membrane protein
VNIVLNFILVPEFGYQGAAVSTLVGYALYPVLVYRIARRYLEWRIPWRSVFKITSAALVGSLVWWGCKSLLGGRMNVVLLLGIALILGSAAYLAALAVLGELGGRELRAIGIGRRGK